MARHDELDPLVERVAGYGRAAREGVQPGIIEDREQVGRVADGEGVEPEAGGVDRGRRQAPSQAIASSSLFIGYSRASPGIIQPNRLIACSTQS